MKVVVLAYHDVGRACLELLLEQRQRVLAVYTHADDPGELPWFGSVAEFAASHDIPLHKPRNLNAPRHVRAIRDLAPDAILSFYYRRLVCREITDAAPRGAFNLHGSLLPRYRGRCPLNWVLVNGERETGVTLHHMIDEPDAGDIVAQRAISISPEDTAITLHGKLVEQARQLLRDTLPAIESGSARRLPQDSRLASCYGKRRPEDGRIDWNRSAERIRNLVRAVSRPWPGAFTHVDGRKLYIWTSAIDASGTTVHPGRLAAGPLVETGLGRLRILSCQLEGESIVSGEALVARGILRPGRTLGLPTVAS